MSKIVLLLIATTAAWQANATSFMTACNAWNRSGLNVQLNMMLVQELGTKAEKLGVVPSVLTAISSGKLVAEGEVFNDLDHNKSQGVFELIEKKIHPVTENGIEEVTVKVRRLSVTTVFKKDAGHDLKNFSFEIEPLTPDDATFLGQGSLNLGGKTYTDVTYNCTLYIDWASYKAMAEKAKKN